MSLSRSVRPDFEGQLPGHAPERPIDRASLPWQSYVDLLQNRVELSPRSLALASLPHLTDVVRELTYARLDARVRAVAARLQQLGGRGERALLVLDNDADYVIAFLACAYAGTVAVTLHTPTQKKHLHRLAHVARDAEARLLLSTRALADRFRAGIDAAEDMPPTTWVLVDEVADGLADEWDTYFPSGDDVAYLQYTSGSTGSPRGVVITHANLIYQGEYMERLFGFTRQDRGLSWLPLFHDMGLILGVLQPIYTGFPVFLSTPGAFIKSPERWLRSITTHRITYAGGPDFCFDLCVEAVTDEMLEGVDLSSWQVALNAAEPVRARTIDRFMARFSPYGFRAEAMNPGYGLAEATLAVSVKRRGTLPVRRLVDVDALAQDRICRPAAGGKGRELVSSGRMLADTVVRIVDVARGVPLAHDEVGEIWVGGSGPARAYWKQPEASESTFQARLPDDPLPYLRTGDLGFVDDEGNLFITGRLKDLIIVHGKNHYPQDIEQTVEASSELLRAHFAAVFAVERDDHEHTVVVVEVKRERTGELNVRELGREIMLRILAAHEISVEEVVFLQQGQLPKTTSGKVQRAQCRQSWLERTFQTHGAVKRSELT